MKKIDEIKYRGFETEFYITGSVKEYFKKNNLDLNRLKQRDKSNNENYSFFYEVLLFEKLDENGDGIPDKKFGKNFKVIYYGIIKKRKEYNEEFEQRVIEEINDISELNCEVEVDDGVKEVGLDKNTFLEVRYKILKS